MENIFDTKALNQPAAPVDSAVKTTDEVKKAAKSAARKEKAAAYTQAFNATMTEDPSLLDKVFKDSDTIAVLKTLATQSESGLIHNKAGDKVVNGETVKDLQQVPLVIGYLFKNVSKKPITYVTAVWAQGPDGKFVAETVEKTVKANAEFMLTRQYTTMLVAQPQFSFRIANGSFVESSKKVSVTPGATELSPEQLKETLEAYYFRFADSSVSVNSDAVKVIIDKKVADDKFEVLPDFVETFGYINNGVVKKDKKNRKSNGPSIDPQVFAANYINSLVKKAQGK